jgi:thioredoxin-like negative regulator of GroEL
MIKPNPDVVQLNPSTFSEILEKSAKPVAILFWDKEDEDLMQSMLMGMRWLKNYSESKEYYTFAKIKETDGPTLWEQYEPQGQEIIVFKGGEVIDRIPGFVYASEINTILMSHINKKATPQIP